MKTVNFAQEGQSPGGMLEEKKGDLKQKNKKSKEKGEDSF